MRMGIVSFHVGSKKYKFKEPLMLETLEDEAVQGGICVTHKELGLSACGTTYLECNEIIREELTDLWEDYALASDGVLAPSAIALKNKLLAMVEGVK